MNIWSKLNNRWEVNKKRFLRVNVCFWFIVDVICCLVDKFVLLNWGEINEYLDCLWNCGVE